MPIKIKPESHYDQRELKMGVKVEMEHTDSPSVASRIARQHLEEFPDYYTRLTKMESRAKRGLAPNPSEVAEYPLSLELTCGSSDVEEEHIGYFDPSESTHPVHEEIKDILDAMGMYVSVQGSVQDDVAHSDAYIYFRPDQLNAVVRVLKDVGFEGDILDIRGNLTPKEAKHIAAVAERNGWMVNDARAKRGLAPNPPPSPKAMAEAQRLLEAAKPMVCGTSRVVDGYWIETHTLGCRDAADEPESEWWGSHLKIYDEYSNDGMSTIIGDPSDGKFATLTPPRGLAPNPGVYVVRDGDVRWAGEQMRAYDLSNGAHIIGLPIDAGTSVSGFRLHVLDVPTGQQRSGIGEEALRWLKKAFRVVDIVDPLPEVLVFWRKMKARKLVRNIEYSDGESED